MRTSNYWEQFLSTGRIKDYLAYREDEGEPEQSEGAGRGEGSDQCYSCLLYTSDAADD